MRLLLYSIFFFTHFIAYSGATFPGLINFQNNNEIPFAGALVTSDYFKASGAYAQFYIHQLQLFEYASIYIHYLGTNLCPALRGQIPISYASMESMLPSPVQVPEFYQIHTVLYELVSRMKRGRPLSEISVLSNMILKTVEDELEGLMSVEWADATQFYYSSLHRRKRQSDVVTSLSHASSTMVTSCAPELDAVRRISVLLSSVPNRFYRLEMAVKNNPALSRSIPKMGHKPVKLSPVADILTARVYDDTSKRQMDTLWKDVAQKQVAWATSEPQSGFRVSKTVRNVDGLPAALELVYPVRLQATVGLKVNKALTKVDFVRVQWDHQKTNNNAGGYIDGVHFLLNRLEGKEGLVEQFFRQRVKELVPLLSEAVQLQASRQEILLRAKIATGLLCQPLQQADVLPSVHATEFLYIQIPNVLKTNHRVQAISQLQMSSNAVADVSTALALFVQYARAFSKEALAYGNVASTLVAKQGVCLTPIQFPFPAQEHGHATTLQYPDTFDARDPSHLLWPLCAGAYPAGTRLIGPPDIRWAEDADRFANTETFEKQPVLGVGASLKHLAVSQRGKKDSGSHDEDAETAALSSSVLDGEYDTNKAKSVLPLRVKDSWREHLDMIQSNFKLSDDNRHPSSFSSFVLMSQQNKKSATSSSGKKYSNKYSKNRSRQIKEHQTSKLSSSSKYKNSKTLKSLQQKMSSKTLRHKTQSTQNNKSSTKLSSRDLDFSKPMKNVAATQPSASIAAAAPVANPISTSYTCTVTSSSSPDKTSPGLMAPRYSIGYFVKDGS